jgi:hypothetical protein
MTHRRKRLRGWIGVDAAATVRRAVANGFNFAHFGGIKRPFPMSFLAPSEQNQE